MTANTGSHGKAMVFEQPGDMGGCLFFMAGEFGVGMQMPP